MPSLFILLEIRGGVGGGATLTKMKYTSNILEVYFQSMFEVYFKYTWSIL